MDRKFLTINDMLESDDINREDAIAFGLSLFRFNGTAQENAERDALIARFKIEYEECQSSIPLSPVTLNPRVNYNSDSNADIEDFNNELL